jgi:hypothetical protein
VRIDYCRSSPSTATAVADACVIRCPPGQYQSRCMGSGRPPFDRENGGSLNVAPPAIIPVASRETWNADDRNFRQPPTPAPAGDIRFITGAGFTDDINVPHRPMLFGADARAAFCVPLPLAARGMPGVIGVFLTKDIHAASDPIPPPIPGFRTCRSIRPVAPRLIACDT